MKGFIIFTLILLCERAYGGNELRWAADTESGAPSVFYDKNNQLVGFEKEIIEAICEQLGKTPVFCQNDWAWLIPGLNQRLYDAVVEGLFRSEENKDAVLFSIPYYVCQLSLAVREDEEVIKSIKECEFKKVGTLCSSKPKIVLSKYKNITVLDYPAEHGAFSDLKNGRTDAVLVDYPAAMYSTMALSGVKIIANIDKVEYLIAVNKNDCALIKDMDRAILELIRNGKLQSIISKWGLNNRLFDEYIAKMVDDGNAYAREHFKREQSASKIQRYVKLLPIFAKAALVTLEVSVCGMILAVILGLALAIIRMYAPRW
ncbi:MAG: transporter substrate-binding domain-containing protein, partial [Puniceicoccales bacterium]|nr:transporter substrate-binding domain-containing protein [Puniceicoccales bacterium]